MGLTREQVVGQLVYHLSGRRVLKYPEERQGFIVPDRYRLDQSDPHQNVAGALNDPTPSPRSPEGDTAAVQGHRMDISGSSVRSAGEATTAVSSSDRVVDEDKVIVVDWYGDDDPENPQNW